MKYVYSCITFKNHQVAKGYKETRKYKLVTKTLEILKPGKKEETSELKTDVTFNPNMIVE